MGMERLLTSAVEGESKAERWEKFYKYSKKWGQFSIFNESDSNEVLIIIEGSLRRLDQVVKQNLYIGYFFDNYAIS